VDFENNFVKSNKDKPLLSAAVVYARDSGFWQYKVYAGIHRGFSGKEASSDIGWSKTVIFQCFRCLSSEALELWPTLLCSDMKSLVGFYIHLYSPKYGRQH